MIAPHGADGLSADNTRHAVVEVRKKLSVLVIPGPDEDIAKPPQKANDSFYLQSLLLTPKHSAASTWSWRARMRSISRPSASTARSSSSTCRD